MREFMKLIAVLTITACAVPAQHRNFPRSRNRSSR
jgi:hypothetical protein